MKKIFAAVLTAVLFCLSCVLCFAAEGENGGSESLTRIADQADLLTDTQREKIEDKLAEVRGNRDFDIVIVTAESAQGKSERDYADDFFDYNGYGCGTGRDGVLLFVNMGSRKTWISTHGEGIRVFTDKGIECILSSDGISSYLSRGDYYGAFEHFIELCDDFIAVKRAGKPVEHSKRQRRFARRIRGAVACMDTAFVNYRLCYRPVGCGRHEKQAQKRTYEGGGRRLYRKGQHEYNAQQRCVSV